MAFPTHNDILSYNRRAWNRAVERNNPWTVPVTSEVIAQARRGEWHIVLTPTKPVPASWFPPLDGTNTLCLASGGGQRGPILAAAGACVTVFDNADAQLARDREVATRDGLSIATVQGDMADLSAFADESFDLIVHPVSNAFVPDVHPVWREAARVLAPGGILLAGFTNPIRYAFDLDHEDPEHPSYAQLEVRHALPYSDLTDLDDERRAKLVANEEALEFGHTLADQIGGQLAAGLVLTGLFEDRYPEDAGDPLSRFMDTFVATRARKL